VRLTDLLRFDFLTPAIIAGAKKGEGKHVIKCCDSFW
jgi:hypothetical protein